MQRIIYIFSILLLLLSFSINSIAQNTQLTNLVHETCDGANDGSITVQTTGCSGGFEYKLYWKNPYNGWWVLLGQTLNPISSPHSFPNLFSGDYKITVSSPQSGCVVSDELFTITTINSFSTLITSVSPTCFGDIDGSITIYTTGGNNSFQYTLYWMNPISGLPVQWAQTSSYISTPQLFPNLMAGDYKIEIDNIMCLVNDELFTLIEPPEIIITAAANQTICNGYAPSSLNASSGGVSGTYSWVNASNPSAILGSGSNFSPPPLTATTTYTVTFTEAVTGCTATDDVVITVVPLTTPTFNQIAPICAGGSFTLPTTSTNGISGSWSPAPNLNTTTTYTFSPTGTSTCATTATMTVVVNPIPTVTLTANPNPVCVI